MGSFAVFAVPKSFLVNLHRGHVLQKSGAAYTRSATPKNNRKQRYFAALYWNGERTKGKDVLPGDLWLPDECA
jgi:hypothetical protein